MEGQEKKMERFMSSCYDPIYLTERLKQDESGALIVDRTCVDNLAKFIVTLNIDYRWDYSTDPFSTTVYLEYDKGVLYGGVFDEARHTALNRVAIASTTTKTPYIYQRQDMNKMKKKLKSS